MQVKNQAQSKKDEIGQTLSMNLHNTQLANNISRHHSVTSAQVTKRKGKSGQLP
jgi:hypothetical protein